MQVVGSDGAMLLNLRGAACGRSPLEPAERDVLRRTLADGKPQVSELVAGGTGDARVTFTMPMHREDGSVLGAVGGALKLQSQSLLPPSMALPERDDSRLVVFSRDGTILSHSDPTRVLGNVRDEAGLSAVYAQWLQQSPAAGGPGHHAGDARPHRQHGGHAAAPSGWLPGSVTRALCWRHWRCATRCMVDRGRCHWALAPRCWCCCWGGWPTLARLRLAAQQLLQGDNPGGRAVAPGAG